MTSRVARVLAAAGLSVFFAACSSQDLPLVPTAVITPDSVTVAAGKTQVFTVSNATVHGWTITSEAGDWQTFVQIDSTFTTPNALRLIALKPPAGGHVYIVANIGGGRAPLAAVLSVN